MLLPDCPHAPGLLVGIDRESDQVHTGNAVYGGKCEAARILTAHEKGCLGCVLNADGIPPPRLDVQGRGPGGVRSLKSPQLPCFVPNHPSDSRAVASQHESVGTFRRTSVSRRVRCGGRWVPGAGKWRPVSTGRLLSG